MFFTKTPGKSGDIGLHRLMTHRDLFLEQVFQHLGRRLNGQRTDLQFVDSRRREFKLKVTEHLFKHGRQATGPRLFFLRESGDGLDGFALELEPDTVAIEVTDILVQDIAFGLVHDRLEVRCG